MCGCSRGDTTPLLVDGVQLNYSNYTTFDYLDSVETVMLKKNVQTPILTTTNANNRIHLQGVIQYALVSRQEADDLLLMAKRREQYFLEIENYNINDKGIVEEI